MARLYRQAASSDRPAWEHAFVAKGIAFGSATVDEVLRLSRTGLGAREVALQTGVSRATVTRWLRGGTPVPDLRPRCDRCAGPLHEPASKAAYAYLLGLYLGDGHVSGSYSWTLTIACDQSYPGIIREARTAITDVLPGKYTSVTRREGTGLMRVRAYDRAWPCLFPQHGPGRKHARPIILADWQAEIVREHPGRLLRGLIHSDGWRGLNRVHVKGRDYAYPRYQFSNRSDDIRRLFTDTCDLMGIAWRPWGCWHISVARRDAVSLLDEHVGPKS
jgi:hypothetical protein